MSHTGQVNFTTAEELLQCDPVMAGMFTSTPIQPMGYLILVHHIHS
jgi:hypothetical protein